MRTIKEWLETLPEPIRSQALANAEAFPLTTEIVSASNAVLKAFRWGSSKEGYDYWLWVYTDLCSDEALFPDGVPEHAGVTEPEPEEPAPLPKYRNRGGELWELDGQRYREVPMSEIIERLSAYETLKK